MTNSEKLIELLQNHKYEEAYDYIREIELYSMGYTDSRQAFIELLPMERYEHIYGTFLKLSTST